MGMKKKLRNLMAAVMAMIILISAYAPLQTEAATESRIRLYTFNVGHADCHIVEIAEGGTSKYVLIDAGANSTYAPNIIKFMTSKKVTRFEYVILTHYDNDHVTGLQTILNTPINGKAVTVGKYLKRDYDAIKNNLEQYKVKYGFAIFTRYNKVNEIIKNKEGANSSKVVSPSKSSNTTFKVGNNVTLTFFNQKATYFNTMPKVDGTELQLASNNDSLVFTFSFKDNSGKIQSMLFTGDIRGRAIRYYNKTAAIDFQNGVKNCIYLSYPHHGVWFLGTNDEPYSNDRTTFFKNFTNSVSFVSYNNPSNPNFDIVNMKGLKNYYCTSKLSEAAFKGETALKYTVNMDTGNYGVRTYPNNLVLD